MTGQRTVIIGAGVVGAALPRDRRLAATVTAEPLHDPQMHRPRG